MCVRERDQLQQAHQPLDNEDGARGDHGEHRFRRRRLVAAAAEGDKGFADNDWLWRWRKETRAVHKYLFEQFLSGHFLIFFFGGSQILILSCHPKGLLGSPLGRPWGLVH